MHMEPARILYVRNKKLNNLVFIKSNTRMFNFDYVKNEGQSKMARNSWSSILNINDWRFWLRKTNTLLNLINNESDIVNTYLYDEDPYETKYQLPLNKKESTGLKYLNDSKAFIEYQNDVDDIYRNIEKYNPNINCIW